MRIQVNGPAEPDAGDGDDAATSSEWNRDCPAAGSRVGKRAMASPQERFQFASDNTAAICPPAWAALTSANADAEISYGDDKWTRRVVDRAREMV